MVVPPAALPVVSQCLLARLGDVLLLGLEVSLEIIQLLGQFEDLLPVGVRHGEILREVVAVAAFAGVPGALEMGVAGVIDRDGISQPGKPLVPVKLERDIGAGRRCERA